MKQKTMKQQIRDTLWAFVKIDLLCFAIYFASVTLLTLIFYHDVPLGQRDFTPIYWVNHIIYFIAYHIIFTVRVNNDKIDMSDTAFDIKKTVLDFFKKDRLQIIFMLIFAVVFEISMLVHPGPQNFVATVLVMFVSSAGAIDIPVLRTVVGLSISLLSMLLSNILIKYKKHQHWNG